MTRTYIIQFGTKERKSYIQTVDMTHDELMDYIAYMAKVKEHYALNVRRADGTSEWPD